MKLIVILSVMTFYFAGIIDYVYAQDIARVNTEVINSIPVSGLHHCCLKYKDGFFYSLDDSIGLICKINPINGLIISTTPIPFSEPKGLAFHKGNIVLYNHKEKRLITIDGSGNIIARSDTLKNITDNYSINYEITNNPRLKPKGIVSDGTYIWIAYFLGYSSKIIRVHPETGIIDKWFFALAEDLEFDGTYLWTVQRNGTYNSSVDKREIPSGKRLAYFFSSGKNISGITFADKYMCIYDSKTNDIKCFSNK